MRLKEMVQTTGPNVCKITGPDTLVIDLRAKGVPGRLEGKCGGTGIIFTKSGNNAIEGEVQTTGLKRFRLKYACCNSVKPFLL